MDVKSGDKTKKTIGGRTDGWDSSPLFRDIPFLSRRACAVISTHTTLSDIAAPVTIVTTDTHTDSIRIHTHTHVT